MQQGKHCHPTSLATQAILTPTKGLTHKFICCLLWLWVDKVC